MTTTIPNWSLTRRRPLSLIISDGDDNPVHFAIDDDRQITQINVDRMALLAALRTELGAFIIDKAPQIDVHEQDGVAYARTAMEGIVDSRPMGARPADLRVHGLAMLALAEYLEAHPPVDPQVLALADLIRDAGEAIDSTEFARRLIATGKVTVQS